MMKIDQNIQKAIVRMMSKVEKNRGPKGDCWNFTGVKTHFGYGKIKINKKMTMTHRFSWEIHNSKKIPEGFFALHKCDNPSCINPDHITIGTQKDNMQHRADRNRQNMPNGESHHLSKITSRKILKIYNSELPAKELSKKYNIEISYIYRIKRREVWKHLFKTNKPY